MHLRSALIWLCAIALLALASATPSFAFKIAEVTSPGGIKAWLVENRGIPLIAMKFSFRAGSTEDPEGKEGVANFLTGMMDEGADDLDSAAFQKLRDDLSFRMSFDAGLDGFEGSFQTLTRNSAVSFDLLRKAIAAPRFDAEPLERVRQQLLVGVKDDDEDPEQIASRAWMGLALDGDPYARDPAGTEASIAAIAAGDLREAHRRIFNRKTLQIAVVGDIGAAELGAVLDTVFGALPEGSEPPARSAAKVAAGPLVSVIPRDIPQSVIVFGHEGILRRDADFIPAYIMTEILAGGGFGSRLTTEIREKRGLTYGVGASLAPLRRAGLFIGSMSTRNEKAPEALDLVRRELKRMADEGPTQAELDEARTYLMGSYALRFDSNVAIAGQLLGIQQENLGIDYVEKRNARVAAVTLDDVKREARRILKGDGLIVAVVGKPEGLSN